MTGANLREADAVETKKSEEMPIVSPTAESTADANRLAEDFERAVGVTATADDASTSTSTSTATVTSTADEDGVVLLDDYLSSC